MSAEFWQNQRKKVEKVAQKVAQSYTKVAQEKCITF